MVRDLEAMGLELESYSDGQVAPQSAIHFYAFEEQHAGNSKIIQLFNGDFSCHVRSTEISFQLAAD
jgi:hypothetical protein